MQYLSVCSGIEAASVAWSPLGFEALAFAEVDKFPSAVLAHHYPQVPNLGDMTLASQWSDYEPNILVGGTPCQSFSVAGLRKGLADPRGNLMLTYLAIADRYQPEWIVWENVPGVLSSGSGRDFGTFLGALGQIGYGWAYRVLDAQFFGVPQRRRRVFVVGHLGDWRRAAAVLFERHSLQGHPPPSRETRESDARPITAGSRSSSGYRNDADTADNLIHCTDAPRWPAEVGSTLNAHYGDKWGLEDQHALGGAALFVPGPAHSLRGEGFDASEDGTGRGTPLVPVGVTIHGTDKTVTVMSYTDVAGSLRTKPPGSAENSSSTAVLQPIAIRTAQTSSNGCGINDEGTSYTLDGTQGQAIAFDCKASCQNGFGVGEIASTMRSMGHAGPHQNGGGHQAVAIHENQRAEVSSNDTTGALKCNGGKPGQGYPAIHSGMQVRRLTPRECERLQGFPSIRERVTVEACTDPQNNTVTVALSCLRWPSNASPVDAKRYPQNANIAENISSMHRADREPLAALSVRTSSADLLHEIRSHGKLMWSASSVAESNRYPPSTQAAGIAAALAPRLRDLALAIRTGKAESLQNIRLSTQARDGTKNAARFGNENAAFASGATNAASLGKFTTSTLGSLAPICGSPVATSLCSVLAAINGCIPNETLPERFSLELDLETPYTLIPFTHGKPAADGPRYKALGNSMAVPVMRWIGERIQLVDWLHAND